ncbi:MAG: hypothetical protein VR72_21130 [Clostridiaceae bacterium BRH_c20a]|nr:MAG: hypothetical protein VR72_21130 [Clostridiaceae bacterium BRH_c20a]
MSYVLSKTEKKILFDLYDSQINNCFDIKIHPQNYELSEKDSRSRMQELVYYIKKLDRLGYIDTQNDFIYTGGDKHQKYENNAILIMQNKIHISFKGRLFVEEARKTTKDRISEWLRKISKAVLKQIEEKIISHLVSFILGVAFILFIQFILKQM